jgi:hypothetical protein
MINYYSKCVKRPVLPERRQNSQFIESFHPYTPGIQDLCKPWAKAWLTSE